MVKGSSTLNKVLDLEKPINLVLSGGGVKGVAHIALLEYLEKKDIPIASISGSSAGALVGALYASGKSTEEVLQFFKSTPIFRYTWLNPLKAGIFDSEKYVEILETKVKNSFEERELPLHIVTTNIEQNKAIYFNKGDLLKPLLASCAVPAVFSPVMIDGELYSDGGVMDNFPTKPFEDSDISMIGSYVCNPSPRHKKDLNSILKVSNHANTLLIHSACEHKFPLTGYTIKYPVEKYGLFDTKNIDTIYLEAKDYIEKLMIGSDEINE